MSRQSPVTSRQKQPIAIQKSLVLGNDIKCKLAIVIGTL